eukprot:Tamp_12616.p1 GENE.Tamp_12616~~Tamp_12616.p1  ORF type:complete len:268 (+),score=49.30 Tamp_12616:544-1347(+)
MWPSLYAAHEASCTDDGSEKMCGSQATGVGVCPSCAANNASAMGRRGLMRMCRVLCPSKLLSSMPCSCMNCRTVGGTVLAAAQPPPGAAAPPAGCIIRASTARAKMAGLDGAAAGPPAEEEAHDGYEQAARPAQDAETVAEEGAAEAAPPPEEVVFALACAGCRGEKYVLCVAGDLLEDDANKDPECGSYFLENTKEWMDECAASVEGKLNCPNCTSLSPSVVFSARSLAPHLPPHAFNPPSFSTTCLHLLSAPSSCAPACKAEPYQ